MMVTDKRGLLFNYYDYYYDYNYFYVVQDTINTVNYPFLS